MQSTWRLKTIIKDITNLKSSFTDISFSRILREANFTIDVVANLGYDCVDF